MRLFGYTRVKPEETVEQWFKRVDDALYEAKAAGRNAVRLAGSAQDVTVASRSTVTARF